MFYGLLLLAVFSTHSGPELNGRQFMALLEAAHSEIEDFEIVCEGDVRRHQGWSERGKPGGAAVDQFSFQARYVYRSDGVGLMDYYQKPLDDPALWIHEVHTLIGGRLTTLVESPESKKGRLRPSVTKGAPGSLGLGGSPERFIFLSYWRGLKYSVSSVGFECEGWEEIDGAPVLRVTINHTPEVTGDSRYWSRYWINMERGGHVVKCDSYLGSRLRTRVHSVVISPVSTAKGKQVWLPTHGEFDSFVQGERVNNKVRLTYTEAPVYRETYKVVPTSILLNRGVKDEAFSSVWKGTRTVPEALTASKEFSEAARKSKAAPLAPIRGEAIEPQEFLERQLAEADRQAKQLDASPAGRGGWAPSTLIQGGLALLGVGVLIAAFITKRRA
jgi:hypothetical protein